MNSVLLILLIVVIKNKIYEMGFVHAKRSVYLDDADAKTVYIQHKRYQTLIFFAIIMAVIVQWSSTIFHLNQVVSNGATLSVITLNMLVIVFMTNAILNNKNTSKHAKILGLFTAVISIIILIIYVLF